MRRFILQVLVAASIGFIGLAPVSAAPLGGGALRDTASASGALHKAQYAGYCKRLQLACIYKEERGEWGRGNCHRYRVECGHARRCEQLRQACVYKEERGEVGLGNCRKYKHECGS
jgi:hypothetical protein